MNQKKTSHHQVQYLQLTILKNSAVEGNPDYAPDVATVTQGHVAEWTNADSAAHTVTSSVDFGETFDSSLMSAGDVFTT